MESSRHTEWHFVSVDVEAAGPTPSLYSLLSIGACLVDKPEQQFYIELQPLQMASVPGAAVVHRLSLEYLASEGVPPKEAMARFAGWLDSVVPAGERPLLVAFNAAFDWMFVNDYFHRFLGFNPLGHTALDIKAYYMGMSGKSWSETSLHHLSPRYLAGRTLTHHALDDALVQADLFRRLLAEAARPESMIETV
jgi:ribonuclease T